MNSLTAKICSQIFLEVVFLIKIVGNLRETRACKPSNIKNWELKNITYFHGKSLFHFSYPKKFVNSRILVTFFALVIR